MKHCCLLCCAFVAICCFACTSDVLEEEPVDFRAKFIGAYKGYRDCSAHNQAQTTPDQEMTVTVDYGQQANYLHVGDDEVLVDSNGSFPHPYLGNYRMYALSFKADSIFIMQQWGALNSNQTCYFKGKKD